MIVFTHNITDIIPPDSVKPEEEEDGDETLYIAVGVCGGCVVIAVVLTPVLAVFVVKRKRRSTRVISV